MCTCKWTTLLWMQDKPTAWTDMWGWFSYSDRVVHAWVNVVLLQLCTWVECFVVYIIVVHYSFKFQFFSATKFIEMCMRVVLLLLFLFLVFMSGLKTNCALDILIYSNFYNNHYYLSESWWCCPTCRRQRDVTSPCPGSWCCTRWSRRWAIAAPACRSTELWHAVSCNNHTNFWWWWLLYYIAPTPGRRPGSKHFSVVFLAT